MSSPTNPSWSWSALADAGGCALKAPLHPLPGCAGCAPEPSMGSDPGVCFDERAHATDRDLEQVEIEVADGRRVRRIIQAVVSTTLHPRGCAAALTGTARVAPLA